MGPREGQAGITHGHPSAETTAMPWDQKEQNAKRTCSGNFHPLGRQNRKDIQHDTLAARNTCRGDRRNNTLNADNIQSGMHSTASNNREHDAPWRADPRAGHLLNGGSACIVRGMLDGGRTCALTTSTMADSCAAHDTLSSYGTGHE